jgi:hypothetical protein
MYSQVIATHIYIYIYEKKPPSIPNDKNDPQVLVINDVFFYKTHHSNAPSAIHSIPPPNDQGKGRINVHYYTRP